MQIFVLALFSVTVIVLVTLAAIMLSRKNRRFGIDHQIGFLDYHKGNIIACFFLATVLFVTLIAWFAPNLGYSHVPSLAEKYSERLNDNVVYQLVAADTDKGDQILLIKSVCKLSAYRILRVKAGAPPVEPGKQFILTDGIPVGIVPKSGESPCKK